MAKAPRTPRSIVISGCALNGSARSPALWHVCAAFHHLMQDAVAPAPGRAQCDDGDHDTKAAARAALRLALCRDAEKWGRR